MKEKFEFLKSVRFWKLVGVGVINALVANGVLTPEIGGSLTFILIGDVAVNTIDRFSKKK